MSPVRIVIAATLFMTIGACATRTNLPRSQVFVTNPEAGLPQDWKAIATSADQQRLAALPSFWSNVLSVERDDALLDPAAALPRPAPPPGTYRCRITRLPRLSSKRPSPASSPPFFCFVQTEEELLTFIKGTGSQRPAGRLWEDGDKRLVFLGSNAVDASAHVTPYGADPRSNLIGVLERIGDFRWRLVLPVQGKRAALDIIELIPETPSIAKDAHQ